jgi:hypothetical protein
MMGYKASFVLDEVAACTHDYNVQTGELSFESGDDSHIYYTLDGSDPEDEDNKNRIRYRNPFIPQGTSEVKYACIDDESNVSTGHVLVNPAPPGSAAALASNPVVALTQVILNLIFLPCRLIGL